MLLLQRGNCLCVAVRRGSGGATGVHRRFVNLALDIGEMRVSLAERFFELSCFGGRRHPLSQYVRDDCTHAGFHRLWNRPREMCLHVAQTRLHRSAIARSSDLALDGLPSGRLGQFLLARAKSIRVPDKLPERSLEFGGRRRRRTWVRFLFCLEEIFLPAPLTR